MFCKNFGFTEKLKRVQSSHTLFTYFSPFMSNIIMIYLSKLRDRHQYITIN